MSKGSAAGQVIGIDQGDRWSHLCVLDAQGEVVARERVRTTRKGYEERFAGARSRGRVDPGSGSALAVGEPTAGAVGL